MIDVDTYQRLPATDKRDIELWLRSVLVRPDSLRCTEIEMVDEAGTCRVRHELSHPDGSPVFVGYRPDLDIAMTDALVQSSRIPEVVRALAPRSTVPPEPLIERRFSAAPRGESNDG